MVHIVSITEFLQLAQGTHRSYVNYLEEQRKIEEEKKSEKEMNEERLAAEKLVQEEMKKEPETIKILELQLKDAQKSYEIAHRDADDVQNVLKDSSNKKDPMGANATKEIVLSFGRLRKDEHEKLEKVNELQKKIKVKKKLSY